MISFVNMISLANGDKLEQLTKLLSCLLFVSQVHGDTKSVWVYVVKLVIMTMHGKVGSASVLIFSAVLVPTLASMIHKDTLWCWQLATK